MVPTSFQTLCFFNTNSWYSPVTASTTPSLTATLMTSSREGRSSEAPSAERREREEERTTRYTSDSGEKEYEAAVAESGGVEVR